VERSSWSLSTAHRRVPEHVEAVAFWGAVVLPFVYLPLLFAGLDSVATQVLFLLLVVLNAVMILLGHRYEG